MQTFEKYFTYAVILIIQPIHWDCDSTGGNNLKNLLTLTERHRLC